MFYNKKHSNLVVLINIVEATVPWNIGSDLLAWNERKIHEIWVQVHGEGEDVKYMLRDLHRYVTFMKRRIQPFSSMGKIFAQSLYKVICNTHTHTHTLSLSLSLSLSLCCSLALSSYGHRFFLQLFYENRSSPFLISCTRTHLRTAELGCLDSTPLQKWRFEISEGMLRRK